MGAAPMSFEEMAEKEADVIAVADVEEDGKKEDK
jgi:hypothetical protein